VVTVRLYAERKRWSLDRVEARATRDPGQGRIASVALELIVEGDLDEDQRQRLHEIAQHCPMHRTLSGGVHIEHV
jgi:putative redox protein